MCLAMIIFLEARGEPLAGQYAVGQVVLNRVVSSDFPDTVCEVVNQPGQFAPIVYKDGAIGEKILATGVAADLYLRYTPNDQVLWFYNPSRAEPSWAKRLIVDARIGKHVFLRKR